MAELQSCKFATCMLQYSNTSFQRCNLTSDPRAAVHIITNKLTWMWHQLQPNAQPYHTKEVQSHHNLLENYRSPAVFVDTMFMDDTFQAELFSCIAIRPHTLTVSKYSVCHKNYEKSVWTISLLHVGAYSSLSAYFLATYIHAGADYDKIKQALL